jgi:hypothetical protein
MPAELQSVWAGNRFAKVSRCSVAFFGLNEGARNFVYFKDLLAQGVIFRARKSRRVDHLEAGRW